MADSNMIVALDIGTATVVCLVAEVGLDREVQVVGVGSHASRGLKRGVVVNIESTVNSIQRAVEDAELMAGCKIHSVNVALAGSHISAINSQGIVALKDREVTAQDLERVIDAARAVPTPTDQRILHILPQEYAIDSEQGIKEPLGMSGVRLEAKVHLVTGAANAIQNIEKCVRMCGLEIDSLVLSQLASSHSVLTEDEKDLGVCLVDIGAGTSDMAVYVGGALYHTAVVPVAGDQVTNDIAVALRTPTQNAEDLKIKYACALSQLASAHEIVKVPNVGDRPAKELSRQALAEVVEPRYDELLVLIQKELRRSGFEGLIPAGIVLTGGTARMEGAVELAEEIFHMPVRLASPKGLGSMSDILGNPMYATAAGLLRLADANEQDGASTSVSIVEPESSEFQIVQPNLIHRMKSWIQANF